MRQATGPLDAGTLDPGATVGKLPAVMRRRMIQDLLTQDGFISVAKIAAQLGISAMSVRRDLDVLAKNGELVRSYGAAVPVEQESAIARLSANELQYETRRRRNGPAKEAIARRACELIDAGETLALDVGSTVLTFERELVKKPGLHVFTNHLRVASTLTLTGNEVLMPGGMVRPHEMSLCGAQAVEQVRNHWFNTAVLGVSALCEEGGFDYSYEDSQVKCAYIERSDRIVVLCDASKFEQKSAVRVFDLSQIDILITEAPPPERLAQALSQQGVRVVLA